MAIDAENIFGALPLDEQERRAMLSIIQDVPEYPTNLTSRLLAVVLGNLSTKYAASYAGYDALHQSTLPGQTRSRWWQNAALSKSVFLRFKTAALIAQERPLDTRSTETKHAVKAAVIETSTFWIDSDNPLRDTILQGFREVGL